MAVLGPERARRLAQAFCRACCAVGVTRICEWRRSLYGVTFLRLRLVPGMREAASDGWTQETLAVALEMIARHYRVITIEEAVVAMRRERTLPRSSAVVVASLPVRVEQIDLPKALGHARTPCVLYVTPGLLERGLAPWPLMVQSALDRVRADAVEMYGRQWLLTGPEQRRAALAGIRRRLYDMPACDRTARSEELVASWGVNLDELPGLKWYEVESLARSDLVTIGAAGLSGDSLARQPLDHAAYEIREARVLLDEHLSRPARHFEYPWEDSSVPLREQVIRAGYVSAIAGDDGMIGMNRLGADPHVLTAHTLAPDTQEAMRVRLAGIAGALHPLTGLLPLSS